MGIHMKLMSTQTTLKANKTQFNDFGKYSYRSCEDILEALKPILAMNQLTVTLSDQIQQIGNRTYIQATATVTDAETGESVSVTAYAREEESKKGMDASQVTGAASSYARKYALNGLFAIDDQKDSDVTNTFEKVEKQAEKPKQNSKLNEEVIKYIQFDGSDHYAVCANCDSKIYDQPKKDGSIYPVEDYVAACLRTYGKPVCTTCRKKNARQTD